MARRFWSQSELDVVRKLYPDHDTKRISEQLGRNIRAVYVMADKLGLKKSREYIRKNCRLQKGHAFGRATQFQKGLVPHNKGLRRPGWYRGRMRETQFKKGNRTGKAAKNFRTVGTILTDTDGYLRIKVRDAVHAKEPTGFGNGKVWPFYHRYLWEQKHGPIPAGHVVVFKDGNRANCDLENLELISRADLARRNAMWHRMP